MTKKLTVKSKDHALALICGGASLHYHVWWFSEISMECCHDLQCCDTRYKSPEEAANSLESYCMGRWDEVTYNA